MGETFSFGGIYFNILVFAVFSYYLLYWHQVSKHSPDHLAVYKFELQESMEVGPLCQAMGQTRMTGARQELPGCFVWKQWSDDGRTPGVGWFGAFRKNATVHGCGWDGWAWVSHLAVCWDVIPPATLWEMQAISIGMTWGLSGLTWAHVFFEYLWVGLFYWNFRNKVIISSN